MLQNAPPDRVLTKERSKRDGSKKRGPDLASEHVGKQLRTFRVARKLSVRRLAELSGLSVNTLSLIENGKTSPSVNTLQQLAQSLDVPITAFFEEERHTKNVVYQRSGERKQIEFAQGAMERLSPGTPELGSEPFIIKLESGANSGNSPIIYAGREFIYCLEGQITYVIGGEVYPLTPGDSLIFDAYTPYSWRNTAPTISRALLVLCPEDSHEKPPEHYCML